MVIVCAWVYQTKRKWKKTYIKKYKCRYIKDHVYFQICLHQMFDFIPDFPGGHLRNIKETNVTREK